MHRRSEATTSQSSHDLATKRRDSLFFFKGNRKFFCIKVCKTKKLKHSLHCCFHGLSLNVHEWKAHSNSIQIINNDAVTWYFESTKYPVISRFQSSFSKLTQQFDINKSLRFAYCGLCVHSTYRIYVFCFCFIAISMVHIL